MRAEKATAVAVIANISKVEFVLHRTHGTYVIPPCPANLPCSLLRITARQGKIDLGDNRTMPFDILPGDIADDLANEANSNSGQNSYAGIFVCEGERPTKEELEEAHAKLRTFYLGIVAQADLNDERGGGLKLDVGDLERRAAAYLGVAGEKRWCHVGIAKRECPACGERIKPDVAVCKSCGAILDKKKAAEFGLGEHVEKKSKQKPEPVATA